MKLYRVTVRSRQTGNIYKQRVFTSAASVHSFKGYWGSRTSGPQSSWEPREPRFTVTVETAFVNNWTPLDENLEKVEKAIAAMPQLSEHEIEALISRLGANLAAKVA